MINFYIELTLNYKITNVFYLQTNQSNFSGVFKIMVLNFFYLNFFYIFGKSYQ